MITLLWFVSLLGIFVFGFLNNRHSPWWFAGACASAAVEVIWFAPEAADATWYLMYIAAGLGTLFAGAWVSESGAFEMLFARLLDFGQE